MPGRNLPGTRKGEAQCRCRAAGPGAWDLASPRPRRPRLLLSGWWRPRPRAGLSGPKKACEPVPPSYPFLRLHVLTGPTVSKLSPLRRGLPARRGRSSATLDSPQGAGGTVGSGRADPGGSSGPQQPPSGPRSGCLLPPRGWGPEPLGDENEGVMGAAGMGEGSTCSRGQGTEHMDPCSPYQLCALGWAGY